MRLELSTRIGSDITQIRDHYERVANPELADEFCSELLRFFEKTLEHPLAYRVRSHDLRRVDLKRFPFHFWFRVIPPDTVRILVIGHHKQAPLSHDDAELLKLLSS